METHFIRLLFICSSIVPVLTLLSFVYRKEKNVSLLQFITLFIGLELGYLFLISFALLWFGKFDLLSLLLISVLPMVIGLYFANRLNIVSFVKKLQADWKDIAILIAALLFLIPTYINMSEWYVGGMDAGNYITQAYSFFNNSSFRIPYNFDRTEFDCVRAFECLPNGDFNPLYLPVFPVLLALGLVMSNTYGLFIFPLIISFASVVGFYVLTKKFFGSKQTGYLAFLILLISPLQILYSKEYMTEILGQFFFFGSAIFLIDGYRKNSKLQALLAFIFVALLLLTKLDSILIIGALAVLVFFYNLQKTKGSLFRFTTLPLIPVAIFYNYVARTYTSHPFPGVEIGVSPTALIITILVVLAFISSFINYNFFLKMKLVKELRTYTRPAVMIILALMLGYLIFNFISVLPVTDRSGTGIDYQSVNILRITYFISLPLAIMSSMGIVHFLWKEDLKKVVQVLPFLAVVWFTLYDVQHSPPLYWWARRYIIFLLPITTAFTGYFVSKLINSRYKTVSVFLFGAFFAYFFINYGYPAYEYKQNDGLNVEVEAYGRQIEPDSIIIADSRNHSNNRLVNTIVFKYDHEVRFINDRRPLTEEKLDDLFKEKENETVYVMNYEGYKDTLEDAGYKLVDCFEDYIPYTFDINNALICPDSLYCEWDELSAHYNENLIAKMCKLEK